MVLQLLFVFMTKSTVDHSVRVQTSATQKPVRQNMYDCVCVWDNCPTTRNFSVVSLYFCFSIRTFCNRKCKSVGRCILKAKSSQAEKICISRTLSFAQIELCVCASALLCNIFILRDQVTFKWTQNKKKPTKYDFNFFFSCHLFFSHFALTERVFLLFNLRKYDTWCRRTFL